MFSKKYNFYAHQACRQEKKNKFAVVTFAHAPCGWWEYFYTYYYKLTGPKGIYVITENDKPFAKYDLGGCISANNLAYDDRKRSIMMTNIANTLKLYYEWVCVCDVDEIIVPHPSLNTNLLDFLDNTNLSVIFSRGLNVFHYEKDLKFDFKKDIISQRNYFIPHTLFYKPSISKTYNIKYSPGYHTCNVFPELLHPDKSLLLFHLKNADIEISHELRQMFIQANYEKETTQKYSINSSCSKYKENNLPSFSFNSSEFYNFEKFFLYNSIVRFDGTYLILHKQANFTIDINNRCINEIDRTIYIENDNYIWKKDIYKNIFSEKNRIENLIKLCDKNIKNFEYLFKELLFTEQYESIKFIYNNISKKYILSEIIIFCYILSSLQSMPTNELAQLFKESINKKLNAFCVSMSHYIFTFLFNQKRFNEIIEYIKIFLAKNNPPEWIYPLMGKTYLKLNNPEKALFYFEKDYSITTSFESKKNIVDILISLNAFEKALDIIKDTNHKLTDKEKELIMKINIAKEDHTKKNKIYNKQHLGSLRSAKIVLKNLFKLLPNVPQSAIDIGCGVGTWSSELLECGIKDILAIDGEYISRSMLYIPPDKFRNINLTEPIFESINRKFDILICLEVAEHLPETRAESFIKDLTLLSDTILFSAAIPYQGGRHHINEQWQSYWAKIFQFHGFFPDVTIRNLCWNEKNVEVWYRQNIILYKKGIKNEEFQQIIDVVHPEIYGWRTKK